MKYFTRPRRIVGLVTLCAGFLLLFGVITRSVAPRTATTIAWSEPRVSVTLFPGETISRSVQFTSTTDLAQVTVEAVPAIAGFMRVDPSQVNVSSNQPQPIQLLFQAPSSTALGTYEGTLHIRQGKRTIPAPLKVMVIVAAQSFANPSLGLEMEYPVGWTAREEQGATVFSNVPQSDELTADTLANESFFQIRRLGTSAGSIESLPANPSNLPIEQWFDSYFAEGLSSQPVSRETTTVGGRPALRIEVSEIGRRAHYYILQGTDVIEITYGLFTPRFVGEYEAMLASINFQ